MVNQGLIKTLALTAEDLDANRSYHADSLVVRCSDFHFRTFSEAFISEHLGVADEIVVPGVGLAFLDEDLAKGLLKYVEVLKQLHGFGDIWFLFHAGCGAYKGFRDASDRGVERKAQLEDMAAVEQLLQGLDVRLHFAIKRVNHTFVPLEELSDQMATLGIDVAAIRADVADRASLPQELFKPGRVQVA